LPSWNFKIRYETKIKTTAKIKTKKFKQKIQTKNSNKKFKQKIQTKNSNKK